MSSAKKEEGEINLNKMAKKHGLKNIIFKPIESMDESERKHLSKLIKKLSGSMDVNETNEKKINGKSKHSEDKNIKDTKQEEEVDKEETKKSSEEMDEEKTKSTKSVTRQSSPRGSDKKRKHKVKN